MATNLPECTNEIGCHLSFFHTSVSNFFTISIYEGNYCLGLCVPCGAHYRRFFSGAEQEWKLSQSNMEVASSSLVSATNELCMASAKAKSATGEVSYTSKMFFVFPLASNERLDVPISDVLIFIAKYKSYKLYGIVFFHSYTSNSLLNGNDVCKIINTFMVCLQKTVF